METSRHVYSPVFSRLGIPVPGVSEEYKLAPLSYWVCILGFCAAFCGKSGGQVPLEYRTLKFPNDRQGLDEKDRTLTTLNSQGWHLVSEAIESGHFKGGEACCLASICLPFGLAA